MVLTPGQEQIGVSRKVEDPEERTRLKELLAGIDPGEDMGVIIRTASEGASKTSIQKDLQFLKRLWKDIRKRATTEKSPSLIYQEADLASRALRDYLAEDIREIWVDDETTLESIRETTGRFSPAVRTWSSCIGTRVRPCGSDSTSSVNWRKSPAAK